MPGISFDRAVEYYDSTRGYPDGVSEKIRDAIVALTGANFETRFLELGVGTGRIALPFIQGGYNYTGVDLSPLMMERLKQKLAEAKGEQTYRYQLKEADVTQLPFADQSYDVILAVHVLHLVSDWQAALGEAWRVLKERGGWLIIANDSSAEEEAGVIDPSRYAVKRLNERFQQIVRELGVGETEKPRWVPVDQLVAFLQELGATTSRAILTKFEYPAVSPREMLERHRARMYSGDWALSDELLAETLARLEQELTSQGLDLDYQTSGSGQFVALAAQSL